MPTLEEQIKAAKRAAVPIISIETPDPAQTVVMCCKVLNGGGAKGKDPTAFIEWDICRSAVGLNSQGKAIIGNICNGADVKITLGNPAEMLTQIAGVPERTVIFMHNAQRFIQNESVAQGVWNLRDEFKVKNCMLVLLGPAMSLPDELKQDVMSFNEDLPGRDEIKGVVSQVIVDAVQGGAQLKDLNDEQMMKICETLTGLSKFGCEQTMATCISKGGIDMLQLWERKRRQVEMTDGLAIWRGGEKYPDLGGCENIKFFAEKLMTGRGRYTAILWLDEIEKMLAGATGDLSGTSQDQLGVILRVMQDWNLPGILFIGHPGTAKSAMVKAIGNQFDVPVVQGDLGAAKGSLVGESERKIRLMMKVYKAISNGQGMVIATCNKLASMPPELRRRFYLGTFMFDLPTAEERQRIWPIYLKKYELKEKLKDIDFDEGWTGAEIKACCDIAWRTNLSLKESAAFIVPVCRSAADAVEALRTLASGKFISAGKPGNYEMPEKAKTVGRKIDLTIS